MLSALIWGSVAASSLAIGAVSDVIRNWNRRLVGLVLGFGAGALVASISFELAEEGFRLAGALSVAIGLALGAVPSISPTWLRTGWLAGPAIRRARPVAGARSPARRHTRAGRARYRDRRCSGRQCGPAGGDLRLQPAGGHRVGQRYEAAGHPTKTILLLWTAVAMLCAAATVGGDELQEFAGNELQGGINGFAAGALLSCWSPR